MIKPGMLTTVQDMGRWRYLAQGVPLSGAMDTLSARMANKVLANVDDAPVLEFTYANAVFRAESNLLIAYAGEGAFLTAINQKLPRERPLFIPAGTEIQLDIDPAGSRLYLAIAGGWDVPKVMGSYSTYIAANFGGLTGRALKANDTLAARADKKLPAVKLFDALAGDRIRYTPWSIARRSIIITDKKVIRVMPGPEFLWFEKSAIKNFFARPFRVDERSSRMGYHLNGPQITCVKSEELLSTAVMPGTIQITGGGQPVLLMADCQTTGGYPRIGQVAAVDMSLCGQLKPGDEIYFKEISRQEAEKLYFEREQQLQRLSTAIRYKLNK